MEKYFLNCHTEDSVKICFRQLSVKMHPDKNGSTDESKEKFQEMIEERDKVLKKIYKSKGWSEADALFKIENIFSGESFKPQNVAAMANSLSEDFAKEHPDKEPNFSNMMLFYMGKVFSGGKKLAEPKKNNDLDK